MLNASFTRPGVSLRLVSAVLLRPFGVQSCSYCCRRIAGLPYPQREPDLRFCNSNCHARHWETRRLREQ